MVLAELDSLKPGVMYESVVVTNPDRPNAAGVGIERVGQSIEFTSYSGSNTYDNILTFDIFSVNLFAWKDLDKIIIAALTGEGNDNQEFPDHDFAYFQCGNMEAPYLSEAPLVLICRIIEAKRLIKRDDLGAIPILEVTAEVLDIPSYEGIEPITRDKESLLDAAVAATRARAASGETRKRYSRLAGRVIKKFGNDENAGSVRIIERYLSDVLESE